jgi:hypothetical protein
VLFAAQWATVSWNERKVYVDVSREFIKNSPEWNSDTVNRDYEARYTSTTVVHGTGKTDARK